MIAYLNDTAKAIKAYQTATELDPDETWSWIYLGRLHQRAGNLAAPSRHSKRLAKRPSGPAMTGMSWSPTTVSAMCASPEVTFPEPRRPMGPLWKQRNSAPRRTRATPSGA